MTGEERRNELLKTIREAEKPISGAALARKYQVSRQVIVQDIALLRAAHHAIYSTPRGYQIAASYQLPEENNQANAAVYRVFHVSHTDEQIEEELNIIVDMGGRVVDVFVEHEVYGSIRAELPIRCRRHVQEFMESIQNGQSSPLKNLTSGVHYHTVEADSAKTMDLIEKELGKKGYLI